MKQVFVPNTSHQDVVWWKKWAGENCILPSRWRLEDFEPWVETHNGYRATCFRNVALGVHFYTPNQKSIVAVETDF